MEAMTSLPAELSRVGLQGWICNSSICMTRRGLKPTGIAIYDAQRKGFASVAHYVQVGTWASSNTVSLAVIYRDDLDALGHGGGKRKIGKKGKTYYRCCLKYLFL